MKTGIISRFSDDKGFGFIKPDDKSKDIFFHVSELKKINLETIAGNTKISFGITTFWIDFVVCYCIIRYINYKKHLCILSNLLENLLLEKFATPYMKRYC